MRSGERELAEERGAPLSHLGTNSLDFLWGGGGEVCLCHLEICQSFLCRPPITWRSSKGWAHYTLTYVGLFIHTGYKKEFFSPCVYLKNITENHCIEPYAHFSGLMVYLFIIITHTFFTKLSFGVSIVYMYFSAICDSLIHIIWALHIFYIHICFGEWIPLGFAAWCRGGLF